MLSHILAKLADLIVKSYRLRHIADIGRMYLASLSTPQVFWVQARLLAARPHGLCTDRMKVTVRSTSCTMPSA